MQDTTAISAAMPAPSRPFEQFPTPEELAATPLRMAGMAYIHAHCGVSPADNAAWQEYVARNHFDAICWGLLALLNQYEAARGLPERWPRETVFDMEPDQLMTYLTAAQTIKAQTGSTVTEDATTPRPTVVRKARPRGKRSTRRLSPIASTTNTAGGPATS